MKHDPLPFVRLVAITTLLIAPHARAQASEARELLFRASATAAPRIALDTPIARSRTATIDISALEAPVERVRIELFDGRVETLLLAERTGSGSSALTWSGVVEGEDASSATFALHEGAVCGSVRIRDKLWRLVSDPHGVATLEEIDEPRMAPCATTAAHRVAHHPILPPAPALAPVNPTIDVLVVYTPQARAGQGGTAAMNALIDLAVLETNQAYSNSHVTQRLRLVHRAELLGYVESGWALDIGRVHNPSDGWLDEVHLWRASSGADVIVLIVDAQGGNCGVSFLMGTLTTAFAPDAICLVSRICATGVYSFGHELGHLMGLAHDRDNSTDKIMRASYSSQLLQGNAPSYSPVASRTGRYVAFLSDASNLVPGDINGFADVFVRDRDGFTTVRANVGPGGVQANGFLLSAAAISQSGALVAFDSTADNLVAGDTNGQADVFVRDVGAAVTSRVSVATGGAQSDGASYDPAISADGRFVAFASEAQNLVAGASGTQVYVHDRVTGALQLLSTGLLGGAGNGVSRRPAISEDGRFVAFSSTASDLVAADTNARADVFVRDLQLGAMLRVSVATGGLQAGGDSPFTPGISADGRHVVFTSIASDLVAGDTNATWDVFVHDRATASTVRASVGAGGVPGNGPSGWMARPSISDDGRWVAFASRATNLVAGDTNSSDDVFLRDLTAGTTVRASLSPSGHERSGHSGNVDQNTTVSISGANADAVVFVSSAVLEGLDSNNMQDAYVFRMSEPDPPGIDTYSYGYRTPGAQYRTIMAYQPGIRVKYYSDPASSWAGFALGIPDPDPYSAEAGRSLNNSGSTVAAFTSTVLAAVCSADGTGVLCPCGNESGPDAGCLNSFGLAGRLSAMGTASLAHDTIVLRASGMPDSFALWFQGTQIVGGGAGAPFGDGIRCAGGSVKRLGTKLNAQGASMLPSPGDPAVSVLGGIGSPGSFVYQVWYRNPAAFCTPDTFNLTNGMSVSWMP